MSTEESTLTVEEEIIEIKTIINQAYRRLTALEKEIREKDQEGEGEFKCTTYLVNKPSYEKERKGKQKSSVCKRCANIRLKEHCEKARKDGTSKHECVCGSIFQKWGLAKHEQSIKHKTFMKRFEIDLTDEPLDG